MPENMKFSDKYTQINDSLDPGEFFLTDMVMLSVSDLQGNILKVNEAWVSVLGYSVDELVNSGIVQFVHPEDVDTTLTEMSKLANDNEVIRFDNRYRTKDGTYRNIKWCAHLFSNLVYSAARDITEQIKTKNNCWNNRQGLNLKSKN